MRMFNRNVYVYFFKFNLRWIFSLEIKCNFENRIVRSTTIKHTSLFFITIGYI